LGEPVTVVNTDGGRGERYLKMISSEVQVVNGPLDYVEYLRVMARHRIVFQLDRSGGAGAGGGRCAALPHALRGRRRVGGEAGLRGVVWIWPDDRELIEIAEKFLKR